jgi:hypothetical protein
MWRGRDRAASQRSVDDREQLASSPRDEGEGDGSTEDHTCRADIDAGEAEETRGDYDGFKGDGRSANGLGSEGGDIRCKRGGSAEGRPREDGGNGRAVEVPTATSAVHEWQR